MLYLLAAEGQVQGEAAALRDLECNGASLPDEYERCQAEAIADNT